MTQHDPATETRSPTFERVFYAIHQSKLLQWLLLVFSPLIVLTALPIYLSYFLLRDYFSPRLAMFLAVLVAILALAPIFWAMFW